MNRALVFGIAMFIAVVGIALVGGEKSVAVAGHGCHGCSGCDGGCDGGCSNDCGCGGRVGLLARLRSRKCCGEPCCGPAPACPPACCGDPCCGRQGLFARLRARRSCCGDPCCGPAPACCAPVCPPSCEGAAPAAAAPMGSAPAPAAVPAKEAPKPAVN